MVEPYPKTGKNSPTRGASTIANAIFESLDPMKLVHSYAERNEALTRRVLTRVATFSAQKMIVFLTPGHEMRTGGVLAIASYYRESLALRSLHGSRVVLCAFPGDTAILKYGWFKNHNYILDIDTLLSKAKNLKSLMIHIPAIAVDLVVDWLATAAPKLRGLDEIHFNVLVMNIDNIRGKNIAGLQRFGKVTCITAHEAYTNARVREELGVPLHRWSVWVSPEQYQISDFDKKEDLLIVSPDEHPDKEQVLQKIKQNHPHLSVVIIKDMSYDHYRDLAARAKWSLTFGEGLDGYFIEPILSGGLSFAVFNDRYFTPPFRELNNLYPSMEDLLNQIALDISRLDEAETYRVCWNAAYNLVSNLYNYQSYLNNLKMFYKGQYTYP